MPESRTPAHQEIVRIYGAQVERVGRFLGATGGWPDGHVARQSRP
ncbi:hypothetical protein ABZS66_45615 [Dactylosporangium sp. NPDC005572]